MTNQRVAAIVVQLRGTTPLILTHVPAKCQGPDDYSVTTITGHLNDGENGYTAMTSTIGRCLGIDRHNIISEQALTFKPMESKGKQYYWYLMLLDPVVEITPLKSEIESFDWNHPSQIQHTIQQMSAGRREMFLRALTQAYKENLLYRSHFPFLSPSLQEEPVQLELNIS